MSTNYYARFGICEKCGRYDEIHLGKLSTGWKFLFGWNSNQYADIYSFAKFINRRDVKIYDENEEKIEPERLLNLIGKSQSLKSHHSELDGYYLKDIKGYEFMVEDFN